MSTAERWPGGLSDREGEVPRLVARGATNQNVANKLAISPRTVQHHVAHIYAKIGVTSSAGAALFADEQGPHRPRVAEEPRIGTMADAG